jgi:hypothetical protein
VGLIYIYMEAESTVVDGCGGGSRMASAMDDIFLGTTKLIYGGSFTFPRSGLWTSGFHLEK